MKRYFVKELIHRSINFSGIKLIRKVALFTVLIATIGFMVACQKEPEKPPVTSKQQDINGKVVDNTDGTNIFNNLSDTIKEDIKNGGTSLKIDAKVQVPKTSKVSVVTVKPDGIDQARVDKIIDTFMKGKQLYKPNEVMTKKGIQDYITLMNAYSLPNNEEDEIKKSDGEPIDPVAIGGKTKARLTKQAEPGASTMYQKEAQELLSKAPESPERKAATKTLENVDESDLKSNGKIYKGFHGKSLNVVVDSGKGYDEELYTSTSNSLKDSMARIINHDSTQVYKFHEYTGSSARGMKMSLEEVKKLAQDTLSSIGVTDLKLTEINLATLMPLTKEDDPNKMNQAYGLWFTRDVAGVPTTLDLAEEKLQNDESYGYERLFMLIDDTGVIEFHWQSPAKVTGTISSDAKIKPFNDIMEIFKKQFFIRYAQSDKNSENTAYNINRITFGMTRVNVKGKEGEFTMVPVWDFFGSESSKDGKVDHTYNSFMTINAIDGSIIDRTQGY
ncbi:DUF6034 family protein [Clostridium sp. YIM B02551]|uniref:DUF6034 family protein n=1 Tax=Clostridium sp. YIM B02551 TaxID=2910679 RepID=UPI001EEA94CD|nr:DUF6034 family protein [Clostridium sp. YIM B02551]